jgi:hypothetical protein
MLIPMSRSTPRRSFTRWSTVHALLLALLLVPLGSASTPLIPAPPAAHPASAPAPSDAQAALPAQLRAHIFAQLGQDDSAAPAARRSRRRHPRARDRRAGGHARRHHAAAGRRAARLAVDAARLGRRRARSLPRRRRRWWCRPTGRAQAPRIRPRGAREARPALRATRSAHGRGAAGRPLTG